MIIQGSIMERKRIYGILILLLYCGMATAQVVVKGNVYGGGEIGKVTQDANVTMNGGTVNHTLFGGGMGDTTDVSAGLVKGNTYVTMTGGQVRHSVYGGGELGSVGNFTEFDTVVYYRSGAPNDTVFVPKTCASNTGLAQVLISGGQVGIDSALMPNELIPNLDDYGYVFCGGQGLADSIANPLAIGFAVTDSTYLQISGGLITASAYGGSENGLVLGNTRVKMTGGQIGIGHYMDGTTHKWDGVYTDAQWDAAIEAVQNGTLNAAIANQFHNCDHWPYNRRNYTIYDIYAGTSGYDSQGGSTDASNGHSFFGNVFGGGSGYYPIAPGVWRRTAGQVNGNTTVEIEGGHILTCVYGGNEYTDVIGKATVKMSGGTLGMPDIPEHIVNNPVVDMLFGGGMGDPRPMFSTWSNVGEVEIEVTGGTIFGSIFGGGEDGHVLGDVTVTVNMTYDSVRIGTWGTSSLDGNIFGAGRGFSGWTATAGDVKGNTTINFQQGTLLGSIYGGGRLGSVEGTATVNVSGGTIGNGTESTLTHTLGGNVFGGAKGRLHVLDSTVNVIWPSLAHVQQTKVHLTGGTVRGNVYGGGELGTVLDSAIVIVDGGTVNRDVYGGGYGSDSLNMKGNYTPAGSSTTVQVTPMQMAGRVFGSTLVQLNGGWVRKSVYGGGEMASVGTVDSIKHVEGTHALALSWPYEFTYDNDANGNPTGITNIQVTGGRLGISGKDKMGNIVNGAEIKEDNGDIYGGGKGLVGPNRYTMAHCANVNRTVITIAYNDTVSATPETYKDNLKKYCITGAVYGGGENGYVNDSTSITLTNGLVGHAMYGGGKGKDTYGNDQYSYIAGKVYGNTHIHVNGGYVVRNVFGGGNLASVGKGNYASISGGTNFGETNLSAADWTTVKNSGHTYIDIKGGQLGMLKPSKPDDVFKDNVPYGSVFGGCRGMALADNYGPTGDLFGFVNFTHVTIGTEGGANTAPKIFGSVYGGAQDGHVRWSANTVVNSGEIGVDYNSTTAAATMGTASIDSKHWTARGNVFGGGSGLGTYETYPNANDTVQNYNPNAGSVIQNVNLTVNGGIIHRNVYGGGDLASVGVPANGVPADSTSRTNVNIYASIGQNTTANVYGGNVFGASRGRSHKDIDLDDFAHCSATEVTIGKTTGTVSPVVPCSVYGGGEIGMVDDSTHVTLNKGVVGTLGYTWQYNTNQTTSPMDSLFISYGGSVYGGGQGLDSVRDAALVKLNTKVEIKGGQVLNNVYGGGELASVGQHDNSYQPVASTGHTSVSIEGGQVGVGPVYVSKHDSASTANDSICIPIGVNEYNGYVYGGGKGIGDDPMGPLGIYGQYYNLADVNTTLVTVNITSTDSINNRIWGGVFGGAEDGHVLDSTKVLYVSGLTGTTGTTGADGNIYGGGRNFLKKNYTAGRVGGNAIVEMTGGQIYGNIYGGGRFALTGVDYKFEMQDGDDHGNTFVRVKGGILGNNTPTGNSGEILIETFSDYSMGNVYGGGKGDTEGIKGNPAASALLIGLVKNSNVIISEEDPTNHPTHVYGIVFGGGEVANVGKYSWDLDNTTHAISNIDTVANTGWAKVTINGGTIGGDRAKMRYEMATNDPNDGNYWTKYNDDLGYVYGGGEGIVDNPTNYAFVNTAHDGDMSLVDLMASVNHTEVEVNGGWIKASVFGGAEAGHVRGNTKVTINDGQIGAGDNTVDDKDELYSNAQFVSPLKDGGITTSDALYRTTHWAFGEKYGNDTLYKPFDLVLLKNDTIPSDGKSWFGNVFGGGSGWFPYVVDPGLPTAHCAWNPNSGRVWGNTHVVITGGHILNNVYGANESTDVGGKATIEIKGGTVGVPQTTEQIKENPSFGLVFGGGSGDPRPIFDNITVVDSTNVIITGGTIYGSVYGGAEDGHVLGDARVTVNENVGSTIIGCTGLSTTDGNIFGGGRNFFGDNDAAGRVEGNIFVTMTSGRIQGSIFGGGRQALSGVNVDGEFPDTGWDPAEHGNVTINVSGTITGGTYSTVIGNDRDQGIHLLCDNDESIGDIFGAGKGDTKNYKNILAGRVTNTTVNITGSPRINGAVFGGGEMASIGWWDDNYNYIANTGSAKVTIGTAGGNDNPVIGTYLELDKDYINDHYYNAADDSTYLHSEWTILEEDSPGVKKVVHTCTGNVFGGCQGNVDFEDWATSPNNWMYMGRSRVDTVIINGGTIMGDVHGGAEQGTVDGDTYVKINGGTIGTIATATDNTTYRFGNVYGGGYGSDDTGDNSTQFTYINQTTTADQVAGRVKGKATVDVLDGTMRADVFGGAAFAYVDGDVEVNIGAMSNGAKAGETYSGNATILGRVFGANNRSGTPLGNVDVNVYKTGHTSTPDNFYPNPAPDDLTVLAALAHEESNFALKEVYGGSNMADYSPDVNKVATVHVYQCDDNTIYDLYGGSNAANVNTNTFVIIDGGRMHRVFGGGNGAGEGNPGANIHGTGTTHIYAGLIDELYGGSNTLGQVDVINLQIEEEGLCKMLIGDVFGGGNEAPLIGEIVTTVQCGAGTYDNFYGGANKAPIYGNVTVNILGGTYNNLFAGSRGHVDDPSTQEDESYSADIMKYPADWETNPDNYPSALIDYMRAHSGQGLEGTGGNVTLNLYGGTIHENAYGGSDANGRIEGKITVNVLDTVQNCPLDLENLYGAGRNTPYAPDLVNGKVINAPEINVIHCALDGNIYGGGDGILATTTANPVVNFGYNETMANWITQHNFNTDTASVTVNTIFGGGNAGKVVGSPKVTISQPSANASTVVEQNVFGGGSGWDRDSTYAQVQGNDTVIITGGWIKNNVYGGGEKASTTGNAIVNISGGQIGVEQAGQENIVCGLVFGGGLGLAGGGNKYYYGNVDSTKVTISDNVYIVNSVFGGGDNGHVLKSTVVNMTGGTVGKKLTLAEMITDSLEHVKKHIYTGSVIAAGRGISPDDQNQYNDTTGRVFGNAHVTVSGGNVRHAVYGGGGLSSVGTYQTDASGNISFITDANGNETGKTYVTLNGNALVGPKKLDLINPSPEELEAAKTILNAPSLTVDQYVDTVFKYLGGNEGWVFGAGCGLADEHASVLTYNDSTFVNISGNAQVVGSVFGGGENGHVWSNTNVNVSGGIIGGTPLHGAGEFEIPAGEYQGVKVHLTAHEDELHENEYGYGHNIFRGNVYGGGKGTDTITGGVYHNMAGRVFGNTHVTISDSAMIYNRVYGGGDLASVGQFTYYPDVIPAGVALQDSIRRIKYVAGTGVTNVVVGGGSIGTNGNNNGDVFGGGRGLAGYPGNLKGSANTSDDADQVVRLAYVGETNVHVYGNVQIKRSVYGGSANGHVYGDSHVTISGGCIGDTIPGEGTAYTIPGGWKGSVYGGGGGSMLYKRGSQDPHLSITSGRVYGNAHVTVSDSAWILNNVYGGGAIASIGTYDLRDNAQDTVAIGTGETHVHIKGGIIGYNGIDNGMVYGSGRGYIDDPDAFADSLSYADTTFVVIGEDPLQSPLIRGSVFGSGENGHVWHNAYVTMHRGIVEQSVYGSGSGLDTLANGNHNPISGIVAGSTQVNINGGLVKRNVYGGGEIAAVGKNTEVNIDGGTVGELLYRKKTTSSTALDTIIHVANSGKVFGGGQGAAKEKDAALVGGDARVNIKSGHVLYSVYGGGELASVNDTAFVTVTGGQVGPAPRVETGYNIPIGLNGLDGYVFGGGQGIGDDPIDYLNHPYGAYYQHANVGTAMVTINMPMPSNVADTINNRLWGSVFGGAEDGHVLGNAHVNYVSGLMGTTGTTSYDGNIFGGGRNFYKKNYTAGRVGGNTYVEMSGGQIYGSIFGGGRLGIVGLGETGATLNGESNYQAMQEGPDHGNIRVVVKGGKVGNEKLMPTWTKTTMGDVFGGGKGDMAGVDTHPEASALLISLSKNTEVIIKDSINGGSLVSRPIIYGSVFGGGEVASVGNYTWKQAFEGGVLKIYDIELRDKNSGLAKVTVSGGIIGADSMQMRHDLATGTYDLRYNDDVGHVFGGGEGYPHNPGSYATVNPPASGQPVGIHNNISLLDIMATVGHTEVTISDSAFVKGSVYGGSMNGHVLNDALVTVRGGQIGCGDTLNRRYTENEFATSASLAECPHWTYGDNNHYYPFDPLYITAGQNPSDGKTWFGNVFGGGSGFYPYVGTKQNSSADSLIWNPRSGIVEGQSKVVIEGGHILTAVYGGGEINSVLDTSFVEMSGGTVGLPRTSDEILAHPITCSLYGSGKGDPRTNFNTYTNVKDAIVEISGGRVFGSVFGGGEEGHVIENTKVTVSGDAKIGTFGYTGIDGNVFGAGRGYAGEALTAGTVGGNTEVNINGGVMLGSVYGGGRDGSVGTNLVPVSDPGYGVMQAGDDHGFTTVNITDGIIGNDFEAVLNTDFDKHPVGGNVFGGGKGNLFKLGNGYSPIWAYLGKVKQTKVNITGGTIKSTVYGGGELGTVSDSAIVIVNGGTIWRDVYGGGFGSDSTAVITASTPNASITAMPMQVSGRVYGNTLVKLKDGWVHKSVYGGGEMASVGTVDSTKHVEGTHALALSWPYEFTYVDDANHNPTGNANVQVTGGRVGITGKDYMGPWNSDGTPFYDPTTQAEQYEKARQDNGDVYGGGKGRAGERYLMAHAGNVNNAVVNINYLVNEATPDNYKDTLTANRKGCIAGAVYGGAENGHVNDSTSITLTKGLIGHAVYGGGKGKGKYKEGTNKVYSVNAGRTYGNTHININPASNDDVYVIRSVFGGGNLASVGKGTYAGGTHDTIYVNDNYYGEFITNDADWSYVRNSGHTYVNIYGGTFGMLDPTDPNGVLKDTIPYGSVFGGCRGMAVEVSPTRFGFVNFTHVTIGNGSGTGPHILGSVYGGAQDGIVRWYANTVINNGEIGVQYDASTAAGIMGSANPDTVYWVMRGNVFGGGAGLGLTNESNPASFSHISGQVIQKANLTINGGTIHRNVYGGGNLAIVGPKRFGGNDCPATLAGTTVNINGGTIGTSSDYGGSVYGGSRGLPNHDTITSGAPYLDFALCAHTLININSVTLAKNVYGGGENGQVGTQHQTDQRTHTSTVNINGTANIGGDVYGGGQGVWGLVGYNNDTISGRVIGTAKVNLNDGLVNGNVFGGGQRGVTYGESYANVSGGVVNQNVFGGAYGHQGYNHVLGLRTVNMRKGEVYGRVYGGSFYAEDALVFRPANFASNTSTDPVSVVNFSGGHAHKQVFGAGDHGQSYGSTYVFVGTNAIMNAPYHTATPTGVYNEAYFNAHDNLIIDGDVYAGADFGDYSQYGAVFGSNTITGRSHIYVDGKNYDTESNTPTSGQIDFMYLRNSLFGCGTLNDGGKQGKQIMVRNYGHDVTHIPNDADPEPLINATRIFQSIQYADSLIIESAHIRLNGRGMVNMSNASKEFAIYNIMDNVRVINGSSLLVDKPVDNIGNLYSNTSSNFANGVYPPTPVYAEVNFDELSPNVTTQNAALDNKIRINKGGYVTVSITETDNNNVSNTYYGALRGFFHLMTDGVYNAFAYARPKQSAAPNNAIAQQYDYATDGGFVSYRKALNYFNVAGGISQTPTDSIQMPYENHAPKPTKHSNETYFRIWRFSENASSVLDVWLIAEAEPTTTPAFGTYVPSTKVKLPPMAGAGAYYRIKRTNDQTPIAEVNYGQEIKMVNAGKKEPGGTDWLYYNNGYVIDQTNATHDNQEFMTNFPNNVFGLTAMPAGAFTGTNATNDTVLVCLDANAGLTVDTLWKFYSSALSPEVEFMLTHSKGVSGNFTWDPISITFEQVMDGNVIDEVTVYVHVVTKTRIDMPNHVKTYAMMTHTKGTGMGDEHDIYKAKVMLPSYQLFDGDDPANWTLKEVKWHPNDTVYSLNYFNDGTLVQCDTYLSHNPTKDFVGMMFYPSVNVDEVNGWEALPTGITPVDLGLNKYNGTGTNPLGAGYSLGQARGDKPISFDFDLHYDSDQNIGLEGNCTMGIVELTVHFDNYKEGSGSDHGQDVKFYVEVLRRGKGKGFYIDGVNGDVLYSGHYPDAAQPSLAGLLYFAPDYEPVDSIYIVNKVTANAVTNLEWNTRYNQLKIFRYPGGHNLCRDEEPGKQHYEAYLSTYPSNPAYKGALVRVKTSMTVSSATINGAYNLPEMAGNYGSYGQSTINDSHVLANAPLFEVDPGATLSIDGENHKTELFDNYNGSSNGGAVCVADGGTLRMRRDAHLLNNYVADSIVSGAVTKANLGGGVYLEGLATLVASDSVTVDNNYRVTLGKVSGALDSIVNQNAYLNDYNTVITLGTMDGAYVGLTNGKAKIGVTKTAWDDMEYMPIVYSDNQALLTPLETGGLYANGQIIFDQQEKYGLFKYPRRDANGDPNYSRKLYWVKPWTDVVTETPAGFIAGTNINISNANQLAWAISYVNGLNGSAPHPDQKFTITADIDMDKYIWVPIGVYNDASHDYSYTGTFEGNGHLVSGIHSPFSVAEKGMFGTVKGNADIKNLQAVVDFYQGNAEHLGGLIGSMNGGTLSNCESAGYLESAYTSLGGFIGGLVGKAYPGAIIHSSFAVDTLKALSADMYLGGLVGDHNGYLYNAYSRALIADGTLSQTTQVGGLVGYNHEGWVENCYSDVGAQNIAAFAYENGNGTIKYCYANELAADYVMTGTGTLEGHGDYEVVKPRKAIGYMYDDNKVNLVDTTTVSAAGAVYNSNIYVPTKLKYENKHTIVWNGLVCVLNQWVKDNPQNLDPAPTPWFRPTSSQINADLPVLAFPMDSAMATLDVDGRFLRYSSELDTLLSNYSDKTSSVFLYGTATGVTHVPTADEKVFVNEDAVLLQAATAGKFINTTVGITFDNSSKSAKDYYNTNLDYDWHLMSTPLSNAKVGTSYWYKDASGNYLPHVSENNQPVLYQNDTVDIRSMVDGYFPNGLKMAAGVQVGPDDVKWDFYSYFEPEYHWINLKRNKKNHFHRDAHDGLYMDLPYQDDYTYPGGMFKHYQIQYYGTDQAANSQDDASCVFTPGKGYMMAISQDSYLSNTGTLNKNVDIVVTAKAPVDDQAWLAAHASHDRGSNLVGNPYQAYLNLDTVSTKDVNEGLNKFWVYDADNGTGLYVPYMKGASLNPVLPSKYIHPHQGFFVVYNSPSTDADSVEMHFRPYMAGTTKEDGSYFRGHGRPAYPLVNLFVSDEQGNSDLAIVEFNRPEVGGVQKIENLQNAEFKLYARFDGESYGLLFTPEDTERVPVFFKTPTSGTYTLSWSKYNGTFSRMRLIDNITGTDYDMLAHDHYTFQSYNTDYAARFYIVFSVTGVDENDDNSTPLAYFNGSGWVVEGEGRLELVDMLGHVLYANNLSGERTVVHFDDFAAGMYMLRLVNSNKILKVQKIVLE